MAKLDKMEPNGFYDRVEELIESAKYSQNEEIRRKIKELVPSYNPAQNGLKELEIGVLSTSEISSA